MASELIRWYDRNTLQPIILVPNAKNGGQHECTLRDAKRKKSPAYGALGSVTSMLKLIYSFGLENWKKEQILDAARAIPWSKDLDIDGWNRAVSAKADEYAKEAREKGQEIHKNVQIFFEQGLSHEDMGEASINVQKAIFEWLVNSQKMPPESITCEKALGSKILGYAGTPDLTVSTPLRKIVMDLKTTDLTKFRTPYDTWMLQLGAYSLALGGGYEIWQIVADRTSGECRFIQYEDGQKWENAWCNLLELWFTIKGYDPRRM